jgi:membrane protease YdiL (CAAX protease family)
MWFLAAVPFQEFFFRGWLQSRLEAALGGGWGMLAATALFTLWHYAAPLAGRSAVPLDTPIGFLSTFAAGLTYAFAFRRTRNILTPWTAHTLSGIAFILAGGMDFTQLL